jgi:predicted RNase H-like nuclease
VRLAGVDGCRGGWVVACEDGVSVVAAFAEVLAGGFDVAAVDIPIGLPADSTPRACDVAARALLGRGRASSVFPAPRREALAWRSWAEASGMSIQAFNIMAKVREVDALMTTSLQDRVVEAHPEVAFALLAGGPMAASKKTAAGRAERRAALASVGLDGVVPMERLQGAAVDDLLDACALLWTAGRVARGEAVRLGDGGVDQRGLRMEIVA